jgi:hypothetical protein
MPRTCCRSHPHNRPIYTKTRAVMADPDAMMRELYGGDEDGFDDVDEPVRPAAAASLAASQAAAGAGAAAAAAPAADAADDAVVVDDDDDAVRDHACGAVTTHSDTGHCVVLRRRGCRTRT